MTDDNDGQQLRAIKATYRELVKVQKEIEKAANGGAVSATLTARLSHATRAYCEAIGGDQSEMEDFFKPKLVNDKTTKGSCG